jgi:hypothetical protein
LEGVDLSVMQRSWSCVVSQEGWVARIQRNKGGPMQVRELIEQLQKLPQDAECFLESLREIHNLRSVYLGLNNRVYIKDHFAIREPKTIKAFDGIEYEVPWP